MTAFKSEMLVPAAKTEENVDCYHCEEPESIKASCPGFRVISEPCTRYMSPERALTGLFSGCTPAGPSMVGMPSVPSTHNPSGQSVEVASNAVCQQQCSTVRNRYFVCFTNPTSILAVIFTLVHQAAWHTGTANQHSSSCGLPELP